MHIVRGNECGDYILQGEAVEQQYAYVGAIEWELKRDKKARVALLLLIPSTLECFKPGFVQTDVQ